MLLQFQIIFKDRKCFFPPINKSHTTGGSKKISKTDISDMHSFMLPSFQNNRNLFTNALFKSVELNRPELTKSTVAQR